MIPVVLVMAQHQRVAVQRLLDYCMKLDGTKIEVIEFGPEIADKYTSQHQAILKACKEFYGQPFFWIEPDAIPLHPDWLNLLRLEYLRFNKPFLLPNLVGLSKTDAASGIGIYPSLALEHIPEEKPKYPLLAWDHYLYHEKSHLIAFTRKIQHSYGVHSKDGKLERRHIFPQDNAIIRPNALIFHADPGQTLIPIEIESSVVKSLSDKQLGPSVMPYRS